MKLTDLIERAPWREAITFRHTGPHEYVLLQKDHQRELLEAVCERFRNGEGVACQFFAMNNVYLFIGDYKRQLIYKGDWRHCPVFLAHRFYPISRLKRKIFEHPFKIPARQRKPRSQHRQERKDNAICRECPNQTMPDRTRCTSCNEKHLARRRQSAEKRRTTTNCSVPIQERLPIPAVFQCENPQPQANKPTPIRPRPRSRRGVNKNLQRPFLQNPPESQS